MVMLNRVLTGTATSLLIAGSAVAQDRFENWDFGLAVAGEVRAFPEDARFPDQFDGAQPSLTLEGDVRWESENRAWRAVFVPFGRLDGQDDERTHADLREAFVQWIGDEWEVRAGLAKVFWGVTESRHLVDVVNQTDAVEDIDEEDKLGQPMVEIANQRDWGRMTLYVLPGFRERTFPGPDGRLRGPLPVDDDAALYESADEERRVDVAFRYSHFIGAWDIGLSAFHGTGREPRLNPNADFSAFIPSYDIITQLGADIQFTQDAWLWKLEALVREGQGDAFAAAVGGFEYTFFGVTASGADLGVLLEYQYDGRDEVDAPLTIADNDVFFGARYSLNDLHDTAILAGAVVDADDGSASALVEAERRLGENWKAELEGRFFFNADEQNPLSAFEDDDVVTLRVTRYF